jgi:hypothetical protein
MVADTVKNMGVFTAQKGVSLKQEILTESTLGGAGLNT